MTVFGCRWRPARVLGNIQGLSVPAAGTKIGTRGEMLPNERPERFGNVSRVRPELDAHACLAVVDDAGLEGDDLDQRLGVEQQEHAGHAVGERLTCAGEEFVDPGEPLVLAQRTTRPRRSMLDGDLGVEAGLLREHEEGPDRAARRRSGGQPFVDILLGTRGGCALVGLVKPHEELHRFGDLLLRGVDRATRCGAGCRFGADTARWCQVAKCSTGCRTSSGSPSSFASTHCSKRGR